MAINSSGTKLCAICDTADEVKVFDTATVTVSATIGVGHSPVQAAVNTVTATIPVGGGPWGIATSPDSDAVYVATGSLNTVAVIADQDDWAEPKPKHELPLLRDLPKLVGKVIGGVGSDGGGWLVIGGKAYKIPPRPLRMVVAAAIAPYVGEAIECVELEEQLSKLSGPAAVVPGKLGGKRG